MKYIDSCSIIKKNNINLSVTLIVIFVHVYIKMVHFVLVKFEAITILHTYTIPIIKIIIFIC